MIRLPILWASGPGTAATRSLLEVAMVMKRRLSEYFRLLVLIMSIASLAACGQKSGAGGASSPSAGGKLGGKVTVLASWGGSEQDAFMAMVKPFEDQTGVQVQYEGTRDLNAVL